MKPFLKQLKLNESVVSMILGLAVIAIAGGVIFSYLRQDEARPTLNLRTNSTETETEEVVGVSGQNTYIVASGDTLWSIAEAEYGTGFEWQEIASANPSVIPTSLEVGEELTIPNTNKILDEAASTIATGQTAETSQANIPEFDQYSVVKGDSLWKIAGEIYGDPYRWVDIARENNLANPNLIHSGNHLRIP